jgi:hypothetical protein
LTDTVLSRLRRESRDARMIRYCASVIHSSTKNVTDNAFSIKLFSQRAKKPPSDELRTNIDADFAPAGVQFRVG